MRIQYKLFLSVLSGSLLLAVFTLALSYYSLNRGMLLLAQERSDA